MLPLRSRSLLPRLLSRRCKTSGVRERGEDGTGTKGARADSPGAAGSGSPNARSCDCGRSAACGRLKEQGSDHMTPPPSLSSSLPLALPPSLPLFLSPLPARAGLRAPPGAGVPLPGLAGSLSRQELVWLRGLLLLFSGFPLLRFPHVSSFGARFKSPVGSFADL